MFQTHFQRHEFRPLTTAHLAQTMTMLGLTIEELRQKVDQELAANPALEIKDERRCPNCRRLLPPRGACPLCSQPKENQEEPVVFLSPREDFYSASGGSYNERGDDDERDYYPHGDDLPTYVLRQIATELEQSDRRMAAYLLAHLDEDGFLSIPPIEIAQYFHVPLGQVEKIQHIIQRADPVGVGSCSTQEALQVQLDILSETQSIPELVRALIGEGVERISHRQYTDLARKLEVTPRQVQEAMVYINKNLNPFPARSHFGDDRNPVAQACEVYRQPDIIIRYSNDDPNKPLLIEIAMPYWGTLLINPIYREAIKQANENQRESLKEDYERASLFIKCLQQRNNTMQRLMQRLAVLQRNYIVSGEKYHIPVTRVSIAQDLAVHESTISRAVSNKTIQLPNRRIIPLASFFDRSLNVRTVLRDIIESEEKPLSDSELVTRLSTQGYEVARRTVAKYRLMEGILPAHLRRTIAQPL